MGNAASREVLLARWTELVNDPSLQDLPYKVELSESGKIEMSPATNRHGILQVALGRLLTDSLPDGFAVSECSILTNIGVRVADVAWISLGRAATQSDDGPYLTAPEICVEITSPANTKAEIEQKVAAYLAADAVEVWLVDLDGEVVIRTAAGAQPHSALVPDFKLPVRRKP